MKTPAITALFAVCAAAPAAAQTLPTIGQPYAKVIQADGWQIVTSIGSQVRDGDMATMTAIYLPLQTDEFERAYIEVAINCAAMTSQRGQIIAVNTAGDVVSVTPADPSFDPIAENEAAQRLWEGACEHDAPIEVTFDDLDGYIGDYRSHRFNDTPTSESDLVVENTPTSPLPPG